MVDDLDTSDLTTTTTTTTTTKSGASQQAATTTATTTTSSSSLEANAHALKVRMASIKSQNAERRQKESMTSSQINPLGGGGETTTTTNDDVMTASMHAASNSELARLQAELQAYKDRERSYVEHIEQIEEENEKFQHIAVEFEQIFHQLIQDKEASEAKYRQEIIELTKERDHLQEDVVGIERSFDDLHRRFDNLKVKVVEFRKVNPFTKISLTL